MPSPETTDRELFKQGISCGLGGAAVIAERMGAPHVAKAIRAYCDTTCPTDPPSGDAEWQSWMVELEMQGWERTQAEALNV